MKAAKSNTGNKAAAKSVRAATASANAPKPAPKSDAVDTRLDLAAAWADAEKEGHFAKVPAVIPPTPSMSVVKKEAPSKPAPMPELVKAPSIPKGADSIIIPLKYVVAALLIAAKDDVRYYLNAVYLHAVDKEVRIVATDGHRMIVSRFEPGKSFTIPDWLRAGLLIPRDGLKQAMPILSKHSTLTDHDTDEPAIIVQYAKDSKHLALRSCNGFGQFTLEVIDGKFPDYTRAVMQSAVALARGESDALTATAIDSAYMKSVGEVAIKLGASAVHPFVGREDEANFFTFAGAPDTVLVIHSMQTNSEPVSLGVMKIVGKNGMLLSATGMEASITRVKNKLKTAKGDEAEVLKARLDRFVEKMKQISGLKAQKAISAPKDEKKAA